MSTDEVQLAARAERALQPSLPHFPAFAKARKRPWSEKDPLGNIILTVAENKLSSNILQARMEQLTRSFPSGVFHYASEMSGSQQLKEAVAMLMQRTFLKGLDVDPSQVLISCGAGAVLETLFFIIANPKDGVLIPAPYYPAFDTDLRMKADVEPIPVHLDCSVEVGPQLESAAQQAAAQGHPIKALLLASPNNPLGTTYQRDTLVQMLRWCLKNNVHLVSDEIYALSIFGEGARHHSTLVVAQEEAPHLEGGEKVNDLVHLIWGMSKDFCASGMRIGILYTRMPKLLQAYNSLSYFSTASGHTQWVFAQLLADDEFVDGFVKENNSRLLHSYSLLAAGLKDAGVPFIPCDSAMFCWVDLRAALPEDSWEGEKKLWRKMVEDYRLLLTPGESCHAPAPGYFRACYAWMQPEALPPAIARIKQILAGQPLQADS